MRLQSVTAGAPGKTYGAPRRNVVSPEHIQSKPAEDLSTVYDILLRGTRLWPDKRMLGSRRVVRQVTDKKEVVKKVNGEIDAAVSESDRCRKIGVEKKEVKEWVYSELSGYEWMTYTDISRFSSRAGSGLRHLGLSAGDHVTLFAATSREWILMTFACFTQSMTIMTAYDTLGEDGLAFSLNEGEVTTMFTQASLMKTVQNIAGNIKTLKNVIYSGEATQEVLGKVRAAYPDLNILSLDELVSLGDRYPCEPVPPKPDDMCCIMYTSGSTGNPKGVMLTHAMAVAGVNGAGSAVKESIGHDDVLLAYLPLAHSFELVTELFCLSFGVSIGYGSPRTLTDSSVRNCLGDIRELRPTLLTGVPTVLESIRKAATSKVRELSKFRRRIFWTAFALKWQLIKRGMSAKLLDKLVFNTIKEQTGGRLKLVLAGGAPCPRSTQKFFNVCICPTINGYGMTESFAVLAVQNPKAACQLGVVGPPCVTGEVKLVDIPDLNYTSANKPFPQGEVWCRGSSVMKGYFKQPELTKEALSDDGWLMTGDIGEWRKDGSLAIIDRKKNLVKLSHGEYIALEKLESIYKTSPFVQNICVYADPEKSFCIAIVQPSIGEMLHHVRANNIVVMSSELSELTKVPEIRKAIFDSLVSVAKIVGLKPAEIVGAVHVVGDEWTPQNGMLTAAQKLRRKDILDKYRADINEIYSMGTSRR